MPRSLLIIAICWSVQLLVAIILTRDFEKPAEEDHESHWEDIEETKIKIMARKAPIKKLVFSAEFFTIFFISVCQIFYGYFVIISYKTYGLEYIDDDKVLTLIGSIGALFNGLGRIFWSSLLDRMPYKKINYTLLVLQGICMLTIQWCVKNKYAYLVNVCISMSCEGAVTATIPPVTIQKFGLIRGHDVFGFMYASYGISTLLSTLAKNTIGYSYGFEGMIYVCAVLWVVALFLTYRLDDNHVFNYPKLFGQEPHTYGEIYSNKFGI